MNRGRHAAGNEYPTPPDPSWMNQGTGSRL